MFRSASYAIITTIVPMETTNASVILGNYLNMYYAEILKGCEHDFL